MNISKKDLQLAGTSLGIEASAIEALWLNLERNATGSEKSRFTAVNVLYYIGALIVIGAMGWFMTKAWESFGGLGIFAIASVYIVVFAGAGAHFWEKPRMRIPAGLLITIAVSVVPLAVYGLERQFGFWPQGDPGTFSNFHPYINASWLVMELVTILAGLAALRVWRFPFLTAPIAYALWFMSMDLADFVAHAHYHDRETVTMLFGIAVLIGSYLADLRGKVVDLSFWGYLFGLAAFWGGLSSMSSTSELSKAEYCLINVLLIFLSVALRRKAFLIFGAMGVFGYLYHLADRVFNHSIFFPLVLSAIGAAIIYAGIVFEKRQEAVQGWFREHILPSIRSLVPPRALEE